MPRMVEDVQYRLIDSTRALNDAAAQLADASVYFLDTEFDQRNKKRPLCLLQVSCGAQVFLIDTLALTALAPLADVMCRENTTWVLHSGRNDMDLLGDALGRVDRPQLFDTQVAWGLQGPEAMVSFAYLNYRLLGTRPAKGHQTDDWSRRPLSPALQTYAARDVTPLPMLYQQLQERLRTQRKHDLVLQVSRELCSPPGASAGANKLLTMSSFRNAWELDPAEQIALDFLIQWYNETPPEDRPRNLKPHVLFYIARRLPESGAELARIKGVPGKWARSSAGDLLAGRLVRATYETDESRFPAIEPADYTTFAAIRWSAWLRSAHAAICEAVQIAPALAFPEPLFKDMFASVLAHDMPSAAVEQLTGWRADWLSGPYQRYIDDRPPTSWRPD